jgi:hypothetical protein
MRQVRNSLKLKDDDERGQQRQASSKKLVTQPLPTAAPGLKATKTKKLADLNGTDASSFNAFHQYQVIQCNVVHACVCDNSDVLSCVVINNVSLQVLCVHSFITTYVFSLQLSKACNVFFTAALSDRLVEAGVRNVTALVCDPGAFRRFVILQCNQTVCCHAMLPKTNKNAIQASLQLESTFSTT